MRVKHIQLELTLTEFRALEEHIGNLRAGKLESVYMKLTAIRTRLDTTEKLLGRIPLREA